MFINEIQVDCNYCEDQAMHFSYDDSRQEWYAQLYECPVCGEQKERVIEFDQKGLIISDEVREVV